MQPQLYIFRQASFCPLSGQVFNWNKMWFFSGFLFLQLARHCITKAEFDGAHKLILVKLKRFLTDTDPLFIVKRVILIVFVVFRTRLIFRRKAITSAAKRTQFGRWASYFLPKVSSRSLCEADSLISVFLVGFKKIFFSVLIIFWSHLSAWQFRKRFKILLRYLSANVR